MCTAISVTTRDHYFGRNLDFEHTFGEKITITPRNYCFSFRNTTENSNHYAIIGMALPYHDYPLYFDAVNEKGLAMAGLYFPDNAVYREKIEGKNNICSFELIPWILTQAKNVSEAEKLFDNINITNEAFDEVLAPSPLHWLISDKKRSITIEQTSSGLKISENPVGVLTNNPTFDIQLFNLNNFMSVSPKKPKNAFSCKIDLAPYSRGMGGIGLPGDLSSMSRFIRACFTKLNSVYGNTEEENVHQFFHVLYSVYQQKGCTEVEDKFEITNYTSCANTDKGIYYYTTYYNNRICAVDMNKENLNTESLITYELEKSSDFFFQN